VIRGEIYRTRERVKERGGKPGFYVVVSRSFIAQNDDVATVVCAPAYSDILGLSTEVTVGEAEGLPHASAVRFDFVCLMFKERLTDFVGRLGDAKLAELDRALSIALALPEPNLHPQASPRRPPTR